MCYTQVSEMVTLFHQTETGVEIKKENSKNREWPGSETQRSACVLPQSMAAGEPGEKEVKNLTTLTSPHRHNTRRKDEYGNKCVATTLFLLLSIILYGILWFRTPNVNFISFFKLFFFFNYFKCFI